MKEEGGRMNGKSLIANSLWVLTCLPESRRFGGAIKQVKATQEARLRHLISQNVDTIWGQTYGFGQIHSIADFQSRVPLTTYADYIGAIEQIRAGIRHVLTREPVKMLEWSSGSTTTSKLIPYTATLQTEFQRGIAPWIVNLYRHFPYIAGGTAYWSVSPVAHRQQQWTGGSIPIGFEDDSEYFGILQRVFIQSIQAVPKIVRWIDNMDTFRYVTLLFLLKSRELRLISVWNPTFLSLLVQPLAVWRDQLISDLRHGTIHPPHPLEPILRDRLTSLFVADSSRASEVKSIFRMSSDPVEWHRQLWQRLQIISCWADSNATHYAEHLATEFPQARIQGKGLLATEGFVSFPLVGRRGAALSIRSHFFEFRRDDGEVLLAHQLEKGQVYEVILTTGGGFYRYQLRDQVEVVGWVEECPLIRFVGKTANISDWFGEKLNESHVRRALNQVLAELRIQPEFVMLACEANFYTVFIEDTHSTRDQLCQLAIDLDQQLQENFHYRYCRQLGQLLPLRVFQITSGGVETYQRVCQAHGQRAGDIKPVMLHRLRGWSRHFEGSFLEAG